MRSDKFMSGNIVNIFLKLLHVLDHTDNISSIFNQIVMKVHILLHYSSIEHKANIIYTKFLTCNLQDYGQNLSLNKLINGLIIFG